MKEETRIYANESGLERSRKELLISVNLRSQYFDRTILRLTDEDYYMVLADALIKQLLYQSKGPITQINIKIRRLSPKERLVYELAT